MILNERRNTTRLNEVKSKDLGNGAKTYKYGDKYYLSKNGEKKEISADQYNKLIGTSSKDNNQSGKSDFRLDIDDQAMMDGKYNVSSQEQKSIISNLKKKVQSSSRLGGTQIENTLNDPDAEALRVNGRSVIKIPGDSVTVSRMDSALDYYEVDRKREKTGYNKYYSFGGCRVYMPTYQDSNMYIVDDE